MPADSSSSLSRTICLGHAQTVSTTLETTTPSRTASIPKPSTSGGSKNSTSVAADAMAPQRHGRLPPPGWDDDADRAQRRKCEGADGDRGQDEFTGVKDLPGPEIVRACLTGAAYAHGLALALPEKAAMARPTGVERANAMSIPIAIARANLGSSAAGA